MLYKASLCLPGHCLFSIKHLLDKTGVLLYVHAVKKGIWVSGYLKYFFHLQWKYDDFDVETAPGRAIKYFDIVKTRDEAADYCENDLPLRGNLITVDNAEINDWVASKTERTWIGLNDKVSTNPQNNINW